MRLPTQQAGIPTTMGTVTQMHVQLTAWSQDCARQRPLHIGWVEAHIPPSLLHQRPAKEQRSIPQPGSRHGMEHWTPTAALMRAPRNVQVDGRQLRTSWSSREAAVRVTRSAGGCAPVASKASVTEDVGTDAVKQQGCRWGGNVLLGQ